MPPCRWSSRAAAIVATLARDRFLERYHFFTFYWDGRTRAGGVAPPGRYKLRVKLLGQERTLVPPGVDPPPPGAPQPPARLCLQVRGSK